MDFFARWEKQNNDNVWEFLNQIDEVENALVSGNSEEMQKAYTLLSYTPLETIITMIKEMDFDQCALSAADVPCFSTMLNGMVRLPELLEFYPEGMSFREIGYQMKKPDSDFACIKYGENHSKLAAKMALVTITDTRPAVIKATAMGLVSYITRNF